MLLRLQRPLSLLTRAMSSSASASVPVRHNFFVYAPDKTEPGTLQRRLSVREKHLVGAKERHETGFIRQCRTHTFGVTYENTHVPISLQLLEVPLQPQTL